MRLGHFSFWLDEILQASFIRGTWPEFWRSLRFDAIHPPLDYLIDRLFDVFRPSDAARRLCPVLWGSLSVLVAGTLVGRRGGRRAGLLTAVFLAAAPFHVRYSQEFRPYALGVLTLLTALLCLDLFLEKGGAIRVAALYVACLATAYALYLAAVVLAIGAAALLTDEASGADAGRRRRARLFLLGSPAFAALLAAAYLPWWPVVRLAASRAPETAPPPLSWARLGSVFSFYAFAPGEGWAPGIADATCAALVLFGVACAVRRRGTRFIVVAFAAGSIVIEALEHLHPHFPVPRHFLPAAVFVPVLAAIAVARVGNRSLLRIGGTAALALLVLAGDARALVSYFRGGRPDWRPLARFLRSQPADEPIVTENEYALVCLAYYVEGPYWLRGSHPWTRPLATVRGDVAALPALWPAGTDAWLVLHNGGSRSASLEEWARPLPSIAFPTPREARSPCASIIASACGRSGRWPRRRARIPGFKYR